MRRSANLLLRSFFLAVLPLFCFIFFGNGPVYAADGVPTDGVQISPLRLDWALKAGEKRSGVVNLKNYSPTYSYDVKVSVEDFSVSSNTNEANFFVPDTTHPLIAYDVINWFKFPQSIVLAPNESQNVQFDLDVPENTATGGYYGAIFFQSARKLGDDSNRQESASVGVNQRTGMLMTLDVQGSEPVNVSARINDFIASKKIFWDNPAKLSARVYNSGNMHYFLEGSLKIDKFGKEVYNKEISRSMIYPDKIRGYDEQWNFTPWSYGKYDAIISLHSADQAINLQAKTSFWIIPWKTTLALCLLIVAIWLVYRFIGRNYEFKKKVPRESSRL